MNSLRPLRPSVEIFWLRPQASLSHLWTLPVNTCHDLVRAAVHIDNPSINDTSGIINPVTTMKSIDITTTSVMGGNNR
jgi:hypothetical protein